MTIEMPQCWSQLNRLAEELCGDGFSSDSAEKKGIFIYSLWSEPDSMIILIKNFNNQEMQII